MTGRESARFRKGTPRPQDLMVQPSQVASLLSLSQIQEGAHHEDEATSPRLADKAAPVAPAASGAALLGGGRAPAPSNEGAGPPGVRAARALSARDGPGLRKGTPRPQDLTVNPNQLRALAALSVPEVHHEHPDEESDAP